MTTVPEIPVVQLPALDVDDVLTEVPASIWAMDVPRGRRPSPLTLAVLGVLAGVAAMALGAAAVIAAGASVGTGSASTVAPTTTTSSVPIVQRRVLALLAKPSTERIPFRGAPGLVLVVGSGGRTAILVRGLGRAPEGTSYGAWIVSPGSAPVLAARFVGTEPAVFLARRLGPRASVVISAGRPVAGPPARNRIVALRD